MKKIFYYVLTLLLTLGIVGCSAQPESNNPNILSEVNVNQVQADPFFKDHDGTFILRDLKTEETYIYNEQRANEKLTPQSTFKVPNALIGLQLGVVRDEYDIKKWDGTEHEIISWNHDYTLGSGMRDSVVWYYQAMARDIGEQGMKEWLHKLSYGNENISGGIDQFWLQSSLKISPLEEVDFMEKLYKEDLPFDKSVMKTVKRMMIQEEGDHYILYGKTGTRITDMGLGWFVGFIVVENHPYVFVTNLDDSGTVAKNITLEMLKQYNLITE
ncbi:class D beta-lactamase [Lysinibacillus agricola]|uniref:Beta-lactamase n=1 Tax=Lysinibacillus agricola TaxID=2590012 RepID=A0ABX7AVF2_9BACI|nr:MULTISPECIES: class D beta-lactamase [Lysinibacillus]KOS62981.1 beta-lactamase [Lysinibacillus sp. FJAT-14222]QQP13947.1 class D beta-lactamase [Lysinibacillus agricola]